MRTSSKLTRASSPSLTGEGCQSAAGSFGGVRLFLLFIIFIGLGLWAYSRWDVWFGNPPEAPYTTGPEIKQVLLTFGDEGADSRYVSWVCDSVVQPATLLLVSQGDTARLTAVGEVFRSRSGQAAYYRAHLTRLAPNTEYAYTVTTGSQQSPWYHFRTHAGALPQRRSGEGALSGEKASNEERTSFSFLYIGDLQDTLGTRAGEILRRAVREHPEVEFLAFGGDLTERPTDAYWAQTFSALDSLCTALPCLVVTGNHDYLKYLKRKCERRFALHFPYFLRGMDERGDANHLYRLTYGAADFFLLDSDRGLPYLLRQRAWLKDALAEAKAPHKIVLLHHPLYSVKRPSNNRVQRLALGGTIQDAGTRLVLQGHEHAYARCTASEEPVTAPTVSGQTTYLVSHCSPKGYRIHPAPRFYPVIRDTRTYQIINVAPSAVTLHTYDATTGLPLDSVTLKP